MNLDPRTILTILAAHKPQPPRGPFPTPGRFRIHSHQIENGDVFVAVQGERTHGIEYADDALQRGAAWILSDREHPRALQVDNAAAALETIGRSARASHPGPVVGITGSVGKTTSKFLLAAATRAHVSPGNINTPLALAAFMLDAARERPFDPWILELGIDRPGDMARLCHLVQPSHGLLTMIAPAHLARLGNLAGVAEEKGALLASAKTARYASESAYQQLSPERQAGVQRYALAEAATPLPAGVHVGHHVAGSERDELVCTVHGTELRVTLPTQGRAVAENALAAMLVAVDLGVPPALAAERIATAPLAKQRLQQRQLAALTLIDDSYNASPVSVRAALELLARMPKPHAIVLGSMLELGDHSEDFHRDIARDIDALAPTQLWTVGDAARVIHEVTRVAQHFNNSADAAQAIDALPHHGTLLVKGSRGIALEQLVTALVQARGEPT